MFVDRQETAGEGVRRLRLQRIHEMLTLIMDYNVLRKDGMPEVELLGRYGLTTGVTSKKAYEYLQVLVGSGKVKRDGGNFLWAEADPPEPPKPTVAAPAAPPGQPATE